MKKIQTAMKVKVEEMDGEIRTRYFRTFIRSWSDDLGGFAWTGDEVDYEGVLFDRVHVLDDFCVVSAKPVVMDCKYGFRPMTREEAHTPEGYAARLSSKG